MKKIFIISLLLLAGNGVFAENIPLKIKPAQDISTCYDELEVGDKILFTPAGNTRLNLKSGAPVIGVIDYIQSNGWGPENAEIQFKKFILTFEDGTRKTYSTSLTINGFEELKTRYPKFKRFFEYFGLAVRGKEIDIRKDKDKPVYNIWISQ